MGLRRPMRGFVAAVCLAAAPACGPESATGPAAESGGVTGATSTAAGTAGAATSGGSGGGTASSGSSVATTSATSGASGGQAGTTATGVGGSAGTTAAGGGAGSAGAGETPFDGGSMIDGGQAVRSAGCGVAPPAGQTPMAYVKYTETIAGVAAAWAMRNYYVWLPAGYDPNRAYPTVFVGPGCGGNGTQGIAIFKASGNSAVVVGLDPDPAAEGRPCFNTETYPDPEEPYFDETLREVEAKFCVDKSRLFIEGFSSGSWMANLIGCVDGNLLRGQGNASGCVQNLPAGTCKGPIAYIGAHNDPDPNNSYACGMANRDRLIKLNGCTNETMPYDPGPDVKATPGSTISCVQYQGCMPGYPVVFCTTTGLGHNSQEASGLSTFGFWRFWMSLPPLTLP